MAENNNTIMDMVRRFAGADPEAEDTVLEMCYRAAVAWYEAAGVPEEPENELWLFWACNLAAWMYDNRGNADANAAVPVYIVTCVHQLRKPRTQSAAGSSAGTEAGTQQGTASETGGSGSEENNPEVSG